MGYSIKTTAELADIDTDNIFINGKKAVIKPYPSVDKQLHIIQGDQFNDYPTVSDIKEYKNLDANLSNFPSLHSREVETFISELSSVAILTEGVKASLAGVKYDGLNEFIRVQDKNYKWVISGEQINACTNGDVSFVHELTLTDYQDYINDDVSEIKFNISTNVLKINIFNTHGTPTKELNINTLSSGRQTTLNALKISILGDVSDCTDVEFTRRKGIIRITSPSTGISTSVFPDLSTEDQDLYRAVGTICNELVTE